MKDLEGKKTTHSPKVWTDQEDEILIRMRSERRDWQEIA